MGRAAVRSGADAVTRARTGGPRRHQGNRYWEGLHDWVAGTLARAHNIDSHDLDLVAILDEPKAVVELARQAARREGRGPT